MDTMKTINVGFYAPTFEIQRSNRLKLDSIKISSTPYYLQGYFRKNYPQYSERVKWAPSLLMKMTAEEIVAFLEKNQIDVLCASLYIWNVTGILDVLKDVKSLYGKPLKIVVGGPSCDAAKDEWETKYSFIDHFVVGQGEKAWASLALDFLGVKELSEADTNIVHIFKKSDAVPIKKYEYEFVRGIHYSPYIECEDMIVELKEVYKDYKLTWTYETQRGCPYHCSFCDWNGGQSNKTQKRKEINFIDEVDFLAKHGMYDLYLADANFGMWDVDVDIMKRMVEHKKNGHNFNFVSFNMSKNINSNFKEIMKLMIEHDFNSVWIKLSVQDVHKNILDAIDRPGNWEESKQFGFELYEEFGISKKLNKIFVELILGLPEQTVESYIATLDEVYGNGFVPRTYPFFLLRNAPATYDMEYRAKYGIKDDMVYETLDMEPEGDTIQELLSNPESNFVYQQIVSCNSFTERNLVEMTMLDQLYRVLLSRREWPARGFIDKNWHHLKPIIVDMIKTEDFKYVLDQRHKNFIEHKINAMEGSHGKLLLNNIDMAAVVSRNFDIINDSFNSTKIDKENADIFLSVWNTFDRFKSYLDR